MPVRPAETSLMKSVDPGILPKSVCFPLTPSDLEKELFFYPTWCGHYYCNENYYMKRDYYSPLLVVYVRQGRFRVEYRGECQFATPGDVVFIDCRDPHYYHAENGLEFLYMHFDGSNSHELGQHIMQSHGWLIRSEVNVEIGRLLFDMVDLYEKNGVESGMERSFRIYRLLELLARTGERERGASGPVHEAITYIRENYDKEISLATLAGLVNLSVYHFSRLFKEQTGFAPMEYAINTRIEQGKRLLVLTNQSVYEIASEVGYGTSGSFINQFTRRVGVSPNQYRKDHNSISVEL